MSFFKNQRYCCHVGRIFMLSINYLQCNCQSGYCILNSFYCLLNCSYLGKIMKGIGKKVGMLLATVPYLLDLFVLCQVFIVVFFVFSSVAHLDSEMLNLSVSADPFETMLKSLLRYQSDGGNVNENHMRKKLYESGVTNSLQSNFALLLKVR